MSNKTGTTVSFLLFLVYVSIILLVAGCGAGIGEAEKTPEMILVTDSCVRISQYAYVCEVSLRDGTRCAIVHTANYDGGAGISCDWK